MASTYLKNHACPMHGAKTLTDAQKISNYFHNSPRAKDCLKKVAATCGSSKRMPQPACQTRFSSLGTTVSILVELEVPIKMVCLSTELNIPNDIRNKILDPAFWSSLKALNPILAGFNIVTTAIQRKDATLASVVRYFTYITHILEAAKAAIPPGKPRPTPFKSGKSRIIREDLNIQ